jgi:ubiquinone/menaquinone biosynthesis C-methylase UbiE
MPELPRPKKLEGYRDAEVAAQYDQRWAGAIGQKRDQRKARAIELGLKTLEDISGQGLRCVLDMPCGTGRFSELLSRRFALYLGADLSPEMLQQAQLKVSAPLPFLAADAGRLPFADQSIDVVLCIRFLHLVRDPDLRVHFLKELARVSRAGVIVDYRHSHTLRVWGKRLRHRFGLLPLAPANPSMAQIRRELAAAGLQPQRLIHVHKAPLLSDKMLIVATRV